MSLVLRNSYITSRKNANLIEYKHNVQQQFNLKKNYKV